MRIKEVCKITGLTDKAIRVYINNELIHPSFTENYNGRKNFDFSESDIALLQKIALLRKYNFSLADIKELILNEDSIPEILEHQLNQTKASALETSFILKNLDNAFENEPKSLEQLCDILSQNVPVESFDPWAYIMKIWERVKVKIPLIIIVILLGVVVSAGIFIGLTILLTDFFTKL